MGVDINPQPNYPYEFHQGDATTWPLDEFDAIHASPPCQAYTTMNNRHGSSSPPLIADIRARLVATGLPWVMENVAGALAHMRSPIELTGEMFGLRVHRPRLFESNVMLLAPARPHVGCGQPVVFVDGEPRHGDDDIPTERSEHGRDE